MGPYLRIWRCHSRALARSVAATLDMSQYRTKPTMRRKPTGIAARACARHATINICCGGTCRHKAAAWPATVTPRR